MNILALLSRPAAFAALYTVAGIGGVANYTYVSATNSKVQTAVACQEARNDGTISETQQRAPAQGWTMCSPWQTSCPVGCKTLFGRVKSQYGGNNGIPACIAGDCQRVRCNISYWASSNCTGRLIDWSWVDRIGCRRQDDYVPMNPNGRV